MIPDPPIRTLKVELLSNNSSSFIPCIPNAREPTPFETEFFKGHAMIIVRTNPVDEHYKCIFEGRKRLFEVQVQGKFKREPQGEIFVGAEATSKMELGLLTRSISRAAMKFCATLVDDLHYSFGDDQQDPLYQLPHAVAPIFPTFDKVIATPLGEIPPKLGIPFVEDPDYGKRRLKFRYIKDADVNLDTTYSFTVNTSQLDLLAWTLVGIPMMRPMDLRTFFGGSSIQLIGYEIPRSVTTKHSDIHPQKFLNYVFCMRLTPIDPDAVPLDLPVVSSDDDYAGDLVDDDEVDAVISETSASKGLELLHDDDEMDDDAAAENSSELSEEMTEDIDDCIKGPLLDDPLDATSTGKQQFVQTRRSTIGWFKTRFGRNKTRKEVAENAPSSEVYESGEYVDPDYELESFGDLSYCCACIEVNFDGKRKYVYMLPVPENLRVDKSIDLNDGLSEHYNFKSPRLRTYSDIVKHLQMVAIPKLHKNKRLSSLEKRRRQVAESYRTIIKSTGLPNQLTNIESLHASAKKYFHFLYNVNDIDKNFLSGNIQLYIKPQKDGSNMYEGHVALALSRRHFFEQYMTLNKQYLSFKSSVDSKKVSIMIKTEAIVSVQSLRQENCLLPDHFGYLQIETWSRVYYLLVRSDIQVNEWLQAFISILGNHCLNSPYRSVYFEKSHASIDNTKIVGFGPTISTPLHSNNSNAFSILDREDLVYYARPNCWKLDRKRRIYNYRRILFRKLYDNSLVHHGSNVINPTTMSPNSIIEHILRHAFYLVNAIQHNTVNDADWVKFWDDISLLQVIDLSNLNETQRLAFFLNLYHVMILHGSLLYGPPPVWNHWHAFFNHICYMVNFEVMSIAEIEYCILRAAMSKTSHFTAVALTAPPQTLYPHLALLTRDFRLHFAINCGSLSQIELVPIYDPAKLDAQLDEITRISLEYSLEIDIVKRLVILPKLPLLDYTAAASMQTIGGQSSKQPVPAASAVDCLRSLAPYLSKQKKAAVKQILAEPFAFTIKHRNYNFKCRFLKKFEDICDIQNVNDLLDESQQSENATNN